MKLVDVEDLKAGDVIKIDFSYKTIRTIKPTDKGVTIFFSLGESNRIDFGSDERVAIYDLKTVFAFKDTEIETEKAIVKFKTGEPIRLVSTSKPDEVVAYIVKTNEKFTLNNKSYRLKASEMLKLLVNCES